MNKKMCITFSTIFTDSAHFDIYVWVYFCLCHRKKGREEGVTRWWREAVREREREEK